MNKAIESKRILMIAVLIILKLNIYAQSSKIKVEYKRNSDNSIEFYYQKNKPGSYTLLMKFTNLRNAIYTNQHEVIKGNSGRLLKLYPTDRNQRILFSYRYLYVRGTLNPKVDSTFVYALPFKKGSVVSVREMKT